MRRLDRLEYGRRFQTAVYIEFGKRRSVLKQENDNITIKYIAAVYGSAIGREVDDNIIRLFFALYPDTLDLIFPPLSRFTFYDRRIISFNLIVIIYGSE